MRHSSAGSTLVRRSGGVSFTARLAVHANSDGTLCRDNASGAKCGAEIVITDDDNNAPVFSDTTLTRRIAENPVANTDIGPRVTATDCC